MKSVVLPGIAVLLLVPGLALAGGTLSLIPSSGTLEVGDTFTVALDASSGGKPINTIESELTFNPEAFAVDHVSTDGSILSSWPTAPEYSNVDGTIHFAGWAGTMFNGEHGHVLSITFKALTALQSPLRFTSGAMLSPEGQETNILSTMESGAYAITTKIVSAKSAAPVLPETAQAASSAPPVIPTAPSIPPFADMALDDRIIIKGTATPSARVLVWIQRDSDPESRTDLYATPDGTFTYVSEKIAQPGTYKVWAATEDAAGVRSVSSPTQTFAVRGSALAAAAASTGNIGWAALPYVLGASALAFMIAYVTRSRRDV